MKYTSCFLLAHYVSIHTMFPYKKNPDGENKTILNWQGLIILVFIGGLISGCGSGISLNAYYWEAEPELHSIDFGGGYVYPCRKLIKIVSTKEYKKLPGAQRYAENAYGPREPGTCLISGDGVTFSLIQLDENVFSVNTKGWNREYLDKYTLLVIAELGLHNGFTYASFADTEVLDETTTTTTPSTTSTSGSDLSSYGYGNIYGFNRSVTTTTPGSTTSKTEYKRVHKVKFLEEKTIKGAFNLRTVAKSIKSDARWTIRGLN